MISALLLGISCTDSNQSLLIEDQTYQDMFVEFAIINHMDEKLLRDTTKEELVERVYDHYGVTEEQFRYTHDTFESNISEQLLRMEKILIRLREERELINEAAQKYEIEQKAAADSLHQRILNR
tara:strand:+ start:75019 stop:75390 length:372 start_codon:yes stop_codon:yes gene_type:complete